MPSESFRPDFHQIDEFNFDSAFVNSDNSASHSLGQMNLRKIRTSFRDRPFGLFRRTGIADICDRARVGDAGGPKQDKHHYARERVRCGL